MMEEQKNTTAYVADLENRGTVCKNGDSGEEVRSDDLIDLLIKLGEEQEQIIAHMREAFERNDNETVLKLAKELTYGKES
jgi:hypothetical protein